MVDGAIAMPVPAPVARVFAESGDAADARESAGIVRVETGPAAVRLPRPRPSASDAEAAGADGTVVEASPPASAAPVAAAAAPPAPAPAAAAAAPATPSVEEEPAGPATTGAIATSALPPLPKPRPEISPRYMAKLLAESHFGFMPDAALKAAIDAVLAGQYTDARSRVAGHADPLAADLVEWLVARQPDSGFSAAEIIAVLKSRPGWPEPERLRLRAEQAFHALGPEDEAVLTFYSETTPRSIGGRLAFAGALRAAERKEEAVAIVREMWREDTLSSGQAASVLARFGSELKRDDHIYRFRRLVLNRRSADAAVQAQLLGSGYGDLARAVIAVLDRDGRGKRLLDGVANRFSRDPLYVFARIRLLRRAGEPVKAANLLVPHSADSKLAGDADVWWLERQDLSRALLDRKAFDLAYKVAAAGRPVGASQRAEAAFHAGWYALRFLKDPKLAEPHFRALADLATLPRTRSRASYWLGRTYEAADKTEAARLAYSEAARFGGTFYGQLAREKIGLSTTGLERSPPPSATDRLRFAEREGVHAIRLLVGAGHRELAHPFFRTLAETAETAGEAALVTALARRIRQPHAGTQAAAIAERRGLAVASLPAPFIGVPPDLPLPETVDRALVYAVVRQESAFNSQATSNVGARGLMQLMPATARATAANAGLPFSVARLTSDPLYNATLGAEHLGELLDRLNQSYVLTFVAYNAGPGRSRDWVKAYGDPRGGAVDPIDWIERIPFDETRNYVQKVMENLQVYRSRIGYPLSLTEDLIRGGPQG